MLQKRYPRLYVHGLCLVRPEVLKRRQILEIFRDHAARFPSIQALPSAHVTFRKLVKDDYGNSVGGWQLANHIEVCTLGSRNQRLSALTLVSVMAHELYHLGQDPVGVRQATTVAGPQGRYQVPEERRAIRWSVVYARRWTAREMTRLAHKELWPLERYPLQR